MHRKRNHALYIISVRAIALSPPIILWLTAEKAILPPPGQIYLNEAIGDLHAAHISLDSTKRAKLQGKGCD